jgi:hypothetical protein
MKSSIAVFGSVRPNRPSRGCIADLAKSRSESLTKLSLASGMLHDGIGIAQERNAEDHVADIGG